MQQSQPLASSQPSGLSISTISFARQTLSLSFGKIVLLAILMGSLVFITLHHSAISTKVHSVRYMPAKNAAQLSPVNQTATTSTANNTEPPPQTKSNNVTVNGQIIPVPSEGTTSLVMNDADGKTTVSISKQSSSNESSTGSSSSSDFSLSINSQSSN